MTTLREAAQQALEALEKIHAHPNSFWDCSADITALRAALAEPVQEPVATFDEVWDAIDWDEWRSQPIRELVRMIHSKTDPKAALAQQEEGGGNPPPPLPVPPEVAATLTTAPHGIGGQDES